MQNETLLKRSSGMGGIFNLKLKKEEEFLKKYGTLTAFLLLILLNVFITPNFADISTFWNLVIQSVNVMLIALGMTVVIATGGIDISVGSVMAVSSIVLAKLISYNIFVAIIAAILVSVLLGSFNGFVVSYFGIQPIIVTLSMMITLRGVAQVINSGRILNFNVPEFSEIAYYRFFGEVPIQLFISVVFIFLILFLMKKMTFGRYVEATGDNKRAAQIAGVNTFKIIMLVYILSAVMAGIAGILATARLSASDMNNMGKLLELDAIAAVAIGGTALSGGKAKVFNTAIGVLIMQLITTMINMNDVMYSYSLLIKSAIIVGAVYIQKRSSK
ncbi:ABC transporter permease [uncultured Ilyobacter sp.]|uniref:ABC transporter permease n=1 Tax=uncultured Ilyobacter sp. TaxID=544433 RepID=UPI0029C7AB18|nr:ABC transporter permease [uncultured Ilyobacter sp.]